MLGIDLIQCNCEQQIIDIVPAQMRVAVGRLDFEDSVAQFEN